MVWAQAHYLEEVKTICKKLHQLRKLKPQSQRRRIPVLNHAIHVTAHQSGDDRKWQNIKEEEPLP
jgi:hypothetical protein